MAFVRLDPDVTRHPKLNKLTPERRWRWLEALAWSVAGSSDGRVTTVDLPTVWPSADARTRTRLVQAMLSAGLWDEVPESEGGGWQIHDFADYQLSSEAVSEQRRKAAERQRRRRARLRAQGSVTRDKRDRSRRDASRDSHVTVTRPPARVPSPPSFGGEETGRDTPAPARPGSAGGPAGPALSARDDTDPRTRDEPINLETIAAESPTLRAALAVGRARSKADT